MTISKTIFFFGAIFYAFNLSAQTLVSGLPIDDMTKLITYQEVVQEVGDKDSFFNSAIGWINQYYPNPVDVTKTRDPQTGKIEGLHRFKIKNTDAEGLVTDAGVIQYEFTLEFKEGRYRYIMTNFVFRQASRIPVEKWMDKKDPQYNANWDSYLTQVDEFAKEWIKNLKAGMKPKPAAKDDQW
jgi:hypothetical protein